MKVVLQNLAVAEGSHSRTRNRFLSMKHLCTFPNEEMPLMRTRKITIQHSKRHNASCQTIFPMSSMPSDKSSISLLDKKFKCHEIYCKNESCFRVTDYFIHSANRWRKMWDNALHTLRTQNLLKIFLRRCLYVFICHIILLKKKNRCLKFKV